MCDFVHRLDEKADDGRLHCAHCSFESQKCRLVQKCWHPGCVKHCNLFCRACVPCHHTFSGEFLLREVIQHSPNFADYKLITQHPGKCPSCSGSGLPESFEKKFCPDCQGSGACSACRGSHTRREAAVPKARMPREW